MTKPLIHLDQAQITRDRSGAVTIDDPDSPIVVVVTIGSGPGPRKIIELVIRARHESARITSAALARLPLSQIRHIAARTDRHPNDVVWRAEITQKPAGSRHWDDDHWRQVLDVHAWATATRRPGGGAQAIADMWGVARNPTAYRWISRARDLSGG